ncbi:winged helix-turn-helix domain-containing protein [Luteimonas abyssi]|uniref:winged helix-turn-helix domain-containing protein n=1 Tax=Luteimonas abyssi TaxID=1247514 RepID=UPI000737C3BD|nr:winged helix-turn-helix domain-containing protein [Luteimonas abyssi]
MDGERWRVGDASVDATIREIAMPGARSPVRVTPKALGVLKALARQSGQVVTRQALLAEVWPETLPTDDVLTQAITQLRKAFGSGSAGPKVGRSYIETIAKSGYRLKQPVSADVGDAQVPLAPAAPETASVSGSDDILPASNVDIAATALPADVTEARPLAASRADASPPARRYVPVFAALALLALGLCALLVWGALPLWPAEARSAVPSYRLITSDQGTKWTPALSPDGARVAYAAAQADGDGSQILVQPARNAPARPLLPGSTPGTRDSDPSWSPDGRDIAFVRRAGADECAVLVAAVDVPTAVREALACDGTEKIGFDWLPDGTGLVMGASGVSQESTGLQVLDLASGALRPLEYSPAAGGVDQAPRVSPDGRWILFARNPQLGDLWRVPVEGGAAERLTRLNADLRGWSWAGSSAVVFGRRVDAEVRLYRLDLASGTLADLGLDDAQAPSTSAERGTLAFIRRQPQFGLFKVDTDAEGAVVQTRVFASAGRDNMPVISPDGRQLAFASDRAGPYELWLAELDTPDAVPVPVEGLVLEGSHAPVWSPSGREVLVAGVVAGAAEATSTALFEVDVARRRAVALDLPVGRIVQGGYADDGSLIAIAHDGRDGMDLIRFEHTESSGWRRSAQLPDVSQFHYVPGEDRVLFTRMSGDGLWQIDGSLKEASLQRLHDTRPTRRGYRAWAVAPDGATVSALAEGPHCLSGLTRWPIAKGASMPSSEICLSADRQASSSGFSIDPRSGALYVSMVVEDGMDIGLTTVPSRAKNNADSVLHVVRRLISLGKSTS